MKTRRWLGFAIVIAVVYAVVGVAFAVPANAAASHVVRSGWRLSAWVVCAAAFGYHLWQEHFRLRNPSLHAALHVAAAVALGGFLLAVWINIHAMGEPAASLLSTKFASVPDRPSARPVYRTCKMQSSSAPNEG